MNDSIQKDKRIRAHFVGAPFFVPDSAKGTQAQFAATGYNTGNLLIGDAAARLLDVDIVSAGTMVNLEALKHQADLIVVPAANFLSPAMDLSWLLPIIEGSRQPVMMIGVGAQFPTTSIRKAELPDVTLRLMKIISERSHSIGARGPFTAEVLNKYGIKNVRVTGCPSLFRMGRKQLLIRRPTSGQPIKYLFNGSSNVLGHAYSASHAREVELRLLELAMSAKAPYVLQNEFPEMLAAAGAHEDEYLAGCKATIDRLKARIDVSEYCAYIKDYAKTFYNVDEWAQFVSGHDLIVGTRFHGNMIAISQGIAAVFVAHDSRTTELCEALHIPYLGLKTFLKLSLDKIIESLDFSAFENNYPKARQNLVEFFVENKVPHHLDSDGAEIAEKFEGVYKKFVNARLGETRGGISPAESDAAVSKATDMLDAMKEYLAARSFDLAVASYERLEPTHPKFRGATLLLAQSLIAVRPAKSAELAQHAIEIGASDAKSYWIYARALYESGNRDRAEEVAKLGLALGGDAEWVAELGKLIG